MLRVPVMQLRGLRPQQHRLQEHDQDHRPGLVAVQRFDCSWHWQLRLHEGRLPLVPSL
jgi:hypothetical protein